MMITIQDLRGTNKYKQLQKMYPEHGHNHRILAMFGTGIESNVAGITCIEDDVMVELDGSKIMTLNDLYDVNFDGIYDIWIRSCKNLTSLTMHIEGVGDVYTHTFEHPFSGDIQIPLSCQETNGKRVQTLMYNKENASFIPVIGMHAFNKITICVNEGAVGVLHLSCVYAPHYMRQDICKKTIAFQICGNTYHYDNYKKGWKYSSSSQDYESLNENGWCCYMKRIINVK